MSGVMVERRDQVLITGGRCPPARAFSTAFVMPLSMYGPFLTERAISLHCRFPISNCQFEGAEGLCNRQPAICNCQLLGSPILQDHLLRSLVAARLVAASRLAPGRHRISSTGGLALAAAVRVVHRIHRDTTNLRTQAHPTRPAGLSERNVLVLDVADLAHSRSTNERH